MKDDFFVIECTDGRNNTVELATINGTHHVRCHLPRTCPFLFKGDVGQLLEVRPYPEPSVQHRNNQYNFVSHNG